MREVCCSRLTIFAMIHWGIDVVCIPALLSDDGPDTKLMRTIPDAEQTFIRSLASWLPMTFCDRTMFAPAAHCQQTLHNACHAPEVS